MNYKIRVNNEEESEEAQELFFELGYVWHDTKCKTQMRYVEPVYYSSFDDMELACDVSDVNYKHKEITLPGLRDLVVLKRNSIDDATHEDKNDPEFKYRLIDNHWYVITDGNPVWRKDSIDLNEAPLLIKPIEKPMKEYLNKLTDGTYKLVVLSDVIDGHDGLIEIPEGAESYVQYTKSETDNTFFLKKIGDTYYFAIKESGYEWECYADELRGHEFILWQRHTQPEELPFVDDEPNQTTINAMNEADALFADAVNHPLHYASSSIECIDAMEAMLTPEQFIGYLRGNAFKYMWRYENKGGVTDLEKAQWYLNKLISRVG